MFFAGDWHIMSLNQRMASSRARESQRLNWTQSNADWEILAASKQLCLALTLEILRGIFVHFFLVGSCKRKWSKREVETDETTSMRQIFCQTSRNAIKCFGRMIANVKTGHWHKLFKQIVVDALQNKTKIRSKNSNKEMHMNLKIQHHSEGTHNQKFSHVQSWNVLFHPRRCTQDFLKVQTEKNHVVFDKHDRGAFVPFLLQN